MSKDRNNLLKAEKIAKKPEAKLASGLVMSQIPNPKYNECKAKGINHNSRKSNHKSQIS